MKQILQANDTILRILRKPKTSDSSYRMLKYCVSLEVEDGFLLFNVLTRELLLLTPEEYAERLKLDYLKNHWFVVPEALNEKEYVGLIRAIHSSMNKPTGAITGYTILPTTDCNARCFYCFELGRSRIPMSEDTAYKTAEYIKTHCGSETVRINWFGGEPLMNTKAIDIITTELRDANIDYRCSIISNGYLFDEKNIERAKNDWNIKWVQISLDGTEAIYNRIKAYVHKGDSAYQIVLKNISNLLDAKITVAIRLNMDMRNAEDMLALIDELYHRFGNNKYLKIYSHLIFDDGCPMDVKYSSEELTQLYDTLYQLQEKIYHYGLSLPKSIHLNNKLKAFHCMADNGTSVVISPDGHIGLCEHFSESEFAGHIDTDSFDQTTVKAFKARCEDIPACDDCFYYPSCIRLKKCHNYNGCFAQIQNEHLRSTQRAMLHEYLHWHGDIQDDKAEPIW